MNHLKVALALIFIICVWSLVSPFSGLINMVSAPSTTEAEPDEGSELSPEMQEASPTSGPEPLPPCTLADQIRAANKDRPVGGCPAGLGTDTVWITDNITLSESLPMIMSNITIEGNGFTLDGAGKRRIFTVHRGKLTIKNLNIRGGYGQSGGAIKVNKNGALVLEASAIDESESNLGGAIYVTGGNLQVRGSKLTNNQATDQGGAIYLDDATARIADSDIKGNSASHGGAISAFYGSLRIAASAFSENISQINGGAISAVDVDVTLSASRFEDNTAGYGGAFAAFESNLLILKTSFTKNSAEKYGGGHLVKGRQLDPDKQQDGREQR